MSKAKQRFKLIMIGICFLLLVALMTVAFILGTEGTGSLPETPTSAPAVQEQPDKAPKKQKQNLWSMIADALDGGKVQETEEITSGA